jgi:uncharacterized protein YjbI with pentapeptide repeats
MKVDSEYLKSLGACDSGVSVFELELPDGFDAADWTYDLQINALLSPLRAFLGWAVSKKIVPLWSMHAVDLSGAHLHDLNIPWADLSGANLRGADLYKANLYKANLRGADLRGADLDGAKGVEK